MSASIGRVMQPASAEGFLRNLDERLSNLEKFALGGGMGARSVCKASLSSATTLASGGKIVPLNNAIFDPGKNFSSAGNCYIAPYEGYYSVHGQVAFFPGVAMGTAFSYLDVNAVTKTRGARFSVDTAEFLGYVTVADILFCKAGDKIELYGFASANCALEILNGVNNYLSVVRVA